MLSKAAENFLIKLRVELIFRGKDENEVDAIEEELRDHLETAEQNGEDIQPIIQTPIKTYADQFSPHLTLFNNISKNIMYFVVFMLLLFILPDFFAPSFTLTVSNIINTLFIFFITIIAGLYIIKMLILKFGDQKKTYVYAGLAGAVIFLLILLSTYLTKKFPIYELITFDFLQSVTIGSIILLMVLIATILLKQKIYGFILILVCSPNIVALLFSNNQDTSQYLIISLVLLTIINVAFIAYIVYQFYKDQKA